jgi:hypothetical protein
MKKSLFLPFALMFLAATGCNSTKTAATEEKAAVEQRDERPQRGGERKTPEERFAEMDANKRLRAGWPKTSQQSTLTATASLPWRR